MLERTGVTPELIGYADAEGILVLQYVAAEGDFFEAIRERALNARLLQLGTTMARLAAVPIGTSAPGPLDAVRRNEAIALRAAWPAAVSWSQRMGVTPVDRMRSALTTLMDTHVHPTTLRLTQGDPAPSNLLFTDGAVRLVDFEYGAVRNALFDLAQWRVRIPLTPQWFEQLCAPLRQAYEGDFDRDLDAAIAHACAYMFTWLPLGIATERDQAWVGTWSLRAALVHTADCLGQLTKLTPGLQPLADWAQALYPVLQRAWPDVGNGAPDWAAMALAPPT